MSRDPFDGDAYWIWPGGQSTPAPSPDRFRTAYFRREFDASDDDSLTVHVSADSRYVLFLNGEVVSRGPAKGDVSHQFYETVDCADFLREGENVLAAVVTSWAAVWDGPTSRMTAAGAFVLDGDLVRDGEVVERLHTDERWETLPDEAYRFPPRPSRANLAGPDEHLDGRAYPHGWRDPGYDSDGRSAGGSTDERDWQPATEIEAACRRDDDHHWHRMPFRLVERTIEPLEEVPDRFAGAFGADGVAVDDANAFASGEGSVEVQSGESASFVLDVGELTTGFPIVDLEGGKGAEISLTYGEALHVDGEKTPVHDTERGEVVGYSDRYVSSGGERTYEPLHWRTFRYVRVEVDATDADGAVTLADARYRFTAYPLEERARFEASEDAFEDVSRLWDAAWRTVRLCAHETFEDCPYYEQLQYAGDTQPVMRFAGYVSGNWDLARQAVHHFDWSRDDRGITKSRYPSRVPQHIPSWSLLWVHMVRDFWWYTGETETPRAVLDGVDDTLSWFARYDRGDGLLSDLPFWKCVDWVNEWEPRGVPPGALGGVSAIINCQYASTLRAAAELHRALGDRGTAGTYEVRAADVVDAVNGLCWDADRGLYRDRPGGEEVSELGNAWAILAGAAEGDRADAVAARIGADDELAAAMMYGRFYALRAFDAAGTYDRDAPRILAAWEDVLAGTDLTTLPERLPIGDSSYCHAWSSTPLYEYLGRVLGVEPAAPGFERVSIAPKPLEFERAEGAVPTPRGDVAVRWEREGGTYEATVETPLGVGGEVRLPDGRGAAIEPDEDRLSL